MRMMRAPYQIYRTKAVKTAKADGIKILRDEIKWDGLDPKTRKELDDAFVATANRKRPQPQILTNFNVRERKFTIPARNQAIVRDFRNVMEDSYLDARALDGMPYRSGLVFARQIHYFEPALLVG